MDPITAMATATASFNAVKKGLSMGKDILALTDSLSKWMGAMSDIDQAEKEAKDPPIFKKLFNNTSVEEEAMRTFANARKAREQREELKNWIELTLGRAAWQDLIMTEGKIRKQRQETIYKQREKRRKFMEFVVWFVMISIAAAILYGVIILLLSKQANAANVKWTTCRLAAMEKLSTKEVLCFYKGAQNTEESHVSGLTIGCMPQYQCKYNPKPAGMSLKDTLDSIKEAMQ